MRLLFPLVLSFVFTQNSCSKSKDIEPADSLPDFETKLGTLMSDKNIPGMIGGVRRNGATIWSKPYGMADKQTNKPVTEATLFHLASLTKPFAAVTIMQLVQQGLVNLDDPVSQYGIQSINTSGVVRVKHLLSHTSEGVPGSQYKYNGDRYALLDKVIETASGKRFSRRMLENVLLPSGLQHTVPSNMNMAVQDGYDTTQTYSQLARGYTPDGNTPLTYPNHVSSAAGLISTLGDMLRFVDQVDNPLLISSGLRDQMFSPFITNGGQSIPYGYGWFVQIIEGKKIIWHYGLWTGISSLVIKVPEMNLSFVLLANSDKLSSPYDLGNGDIMKSAFAKLFLQSFVLNGAKL